MMFFASDETTGESGNCKLPRVMFRQVSSVSFPL